MKIKKVSKKVLHTPVDVYDLSVPVTQNFCLDNGCVVHNSKDCSDAVTGVVYGLSTRKELWIRHGVSHSAFSNEIKTAQAAAENKMLDVINE